jgi:hypothetical protein
MANTRRDGAKERFWRDVLRRQARSGLSVRAFCRHERLSEASFYAWRRTTRARDGRADRAVGSRRPAFVPVTLGAPPRPAASITIELAGRLVLRLPESIPAQRLAQIVHALESPAAP